MTNTRKAALAALALVVGVSSSSAVATPTKSAPTIELPVTTLHGHTETGGDLWLYRMCDGTTAIYMSRVLDNFTQTVNTVDNSAQCDPNG